MNSAEKVAILLDHWTHPGFQFHVAEEAKGGTVIFERSSFVPLEAASYREPVSVPDTMQRTETLIYPLAPDDEAVRRTFPELIAPHKRKRKPSMAYAARLAKREGVQVAMATDGTVTMTPVKPLDITPTDDTTTRNPWDEVLSNVTH